MGHEYGSDELGRVLNSLDVWLASFIWDIYGVDQFWALLHMTGNGKPISCNRICE